MSAFEPSTYQVGDMPLHCPICAYDEFWQRGAQLNTAFATLLGVDWLNPTAVCYICDRCGHIMWFMPSPPEPHE